MIRVILTDPSNSATDEEKNKLNQMGTERTGVFSITNEVNTLLNSQLIVQHSPQPGLDVNSCTNIWLIETGGGGKADIPPTQKGRRGSIDWKTFVENIENFVVHIRAKSEITKEDIDVLYAIDPKLEKLLEPFDSVSPYATEYTDKDKSKKSLKDAKSELQNYVGEYLKKQSKS